MNTHHIVKLGTVGHAFNPSTQEVEVETSEAQVHLQLHSELKASLGYTSIFLKKEERNEGEGEEMKERRNGGREVEQGWKEEGGRRKERKTGKEGARIKRYLGISRHL